MAKPKYKEWLTDEGLRKITLWARKGLTEDQIAQNMGINMRTLTRWKNMEVEGQCPICLAIKRGRERPLEILTNALYEKAKGFTGEDGRYYPPDTGANIFLHKNWNKEEYRDKPLLDVEIKELELKNEAAEVNINIKKLEEQIKVLEKQLKELEIKRVASLIENDVEDNGLLEAIKNLSESLKEENED